MLHTNKQTCCKDCRTEYMRGFRARNREYLRAYSKGRTPQIRDKRRDYSLRTRYGIDLGYKIALLESQGGKCANPGCGESLEPRQKAAHVDHCHKTGKVRGVLCNGCNRGLGYLSDSRRKLLGLAEYLEKVNNAE